VITMTAQPALTLRAYQEAGIESVDAAFQAGHRAVVLSSPTGSGKTAWASEYVARDAARGWRVLILTNRRILLSQADRCLERCGIRHGVFAAGYEPEPAEPIQLGSIQTCLAREALPDCDTVLVDEAHSAASGRTRRAIERCKARGAKIVGLTATPVGLAGLYDALVTMSSNSELIAQGVLVPGTVFAPSEPSMKGVRIVRGEYVQGQMRQRVMQCLVFGDVFDHFRRLNPDMRPSALFAPGVAESRWFVDRFNERGVSAAHIDGTTPQAERAAIFAGLESGSLVLVSSYGVLREGWNCPIVSHGLIIQACHGLSTYLQIVGRLKRSAEGKQRYTLQDHSGCWHRHGNPDADRTWSLDDTDSEIARRRREACEAGTEIQPLRCPECGAVRESGCVCPQCGARHMQSVRVVRQTDGRLVEMHGPAIREKPLEPTLRHRVAVATGEAKDGRAWI
jgi:DNA repair protein RadD